MGEVTHDSHFQKDLRSYFHSMQSFIYLSLFAVFCGYYACKQITMPSVDGGVPPARFLAACALLSRFYCRSSPCAALPGSASGALSAWCSPPPLARFPWPLANFWPARLWLPSHYCRRPFCPLSLPVWATSLLESFSWCSWGAWFFSFAVAALGVFVSSMCLTPMGSYFGTAGILIVFWMAGNILPNLGSSTLRALLSSLALFEAPAIFSYGIFAVFDDPLSSFLCCNLHFLLCAKSLDLERRTR